MKFDQPLTEGTLIKRYKRFLADVKLSSGKVETVYCPNTGTMKNCWEPGDQVYLSLHRGTKRKYPYTLELINHSSELIVVNTHRANTVVEEALSERLIAPLQNLVIDKREAMHQSSRIDFLLHDVDQPQIKTWLEVKSVTLLEEGCLYFPDTVSTRGQKHLKELTSIAQSGQKAVLFFLINRSSGSIFKPAKHIDPEYAKLLMKAKDQGVKILAFKAEISPECIRVGSSCPVEMG